MNVLIVINPSIDVISEIEICRAWLFGTLKRTISVPHLSTQRVFLNVLFETLHLSINYASVSGFPQKGSTISIYNAVELEDKFIASRRRAEVACAIYALQEGGSVWMAVVLHRAYLMSTSLKAGLITFGYVFNAFRW
jgi:hypothetical protein